MEYKSSKKGIEIFMYIIHEDDLMYIGDMGINNDISYEGIVYTIDYITGNLTGIFPFKEGFRWGICREWYEPGQLKEETSIIRGHINNYEKQWHRNGVLKSVAKYTPAERLSAGEMIFYKEWDEKGKLIKATNSKNYKANDFHKSKDSFLSYPNDDSIEKLKCDEHLNNDKYFDIYKYAINEELLDFSDGKVTFNSEAFTGLAYKIPTSQDERINIIRICTYKDGYTHGTFFEWHLNVFLNYDLLTSLALGEEYEDDAGNIIEVLPRGSSKGMLKILAHYESGVELDYKEWDKNGKLIIER